MSAAEHEDVGSSVARLLEAKKQIDIVLENEEEALPLGRVADLHMSAGRIANAAEFLEGDD